MTPAGDTNTSRDIACAIMPAEENNIQQRTIEMDSIKEASACHSEQLVLNVDDNSKDDTYNKMSLIRSSKDLPFPAKLHHVMSCVEFEDAISWLPHGHAWRVKNVDAFEKKVIPIFFQHFRCNSFMEHVNAWGFKKIAHGSDADSYYHKLFLRDSPRLCLNMRRVKGQAQDFLKNRPDVKKVESCTPIKGGLCENERESCTFEEVKTQLSNVHSLRALRRHSAPPLNMTPTSVPMSILIRNQIELRRARDDLQRSQAEISKNMKLRQHPQSDLNPAQHQSGFNGLQDRLVDIFSVKPVSADVYDDISNLRRALAEAERKNKILVETIAASMQKPDTHQEHECLASLWPQRRGPQEYLMGNMHEKKEQHNNLFVGSLPDHRQHQHESCTRVSSTKEKSQDPFF